MFTSSTVITRAERDGRARVAAPSRLVGSTVLGVDALRVDAVHHPARVAREHRGRAQVDVVEGRRLGSARWIRARAAARQKLLLAGPQAL